MRESSWRRLSPLLGLAEALGLERFFQDNILLFVEVLEFLLEGEEEKLKAFIDQ